MPSCFNFAGVPPAVIWKEAINRTLAQMPHIRQRAADKARQKSTSQKQNEFGSRRRTSSKAPSPSEGSHRGAQLGSKHGRRASQSPEPGAREAQKGTTRQRRESTIPATEEHLHTAAGSSGDRHRRSSASPEARRRRGSQKTEGRRSSAKATPAHGTKDTDPRGSAARRSHAESPGPAQKPARGSRPQPPKQPSEALGAPKKKISRGILSRAGSIFRRTATGVAANQSDQ